MSDRGFGALMMAAMLILPVSALVARRLPPETWLRYAAAWLAIFALGFLVVRSFT